MDLRGAGISDRGHVCHSPQHAASPVYAFNPEDSSTGNRCSITSLAGTVDVHVFPISLTEKGHSETSSHSGRRCHANSLLWPSTPNFLHLIQLCVDHPRIQPCSRGIDLLGPTAAQIATFLYSLFDTHDLSPQTVKSYRSCIASPHRAAVIQDRIVSDMISSMELQSYQNRTLVLS